LSLNKLRIKRNNKGISTIFGMVFFLLIVVIVFASFAVVLNENTSLEATMIQSRQIDLDKANELLVLKSVTGGNFLINNSSPLTAQVVRLWYQDTNGNSIPIPVPLAQQAILPNEEKPYGQGIVPSNQARYWFITARGNQFSYLIQGGKGQDGINGINGKDGANGMAEVSNGIGFIGMDFNSFRSYQTSSSPPTTPALSYSYRISQGNYSAFSLNVTNVEPTGRNITINSQSSIWALNPPTSSGATKGFNWNIAKLNGNQIIPFSGGDTKLLPNNVTVTLYFVTTSKPGQNTINTGAAAVNLLLTGTIWNTTSTRDYGQNLPFISITIVS